MENSSEIRLTRTDQKDAIFRGRLIDREHAVRATAGRINSVYLYETESGRKLLYVSVWNGLRNESTLHDLRDLASIADVVPLEPCVKRLMARLGVDPVERIE